MRGQTTPRKQPISIGQKEGSPKKVTGNAPSLISTQGTTYTTPASSKAPNDEGALPQDLFEDSEKTEGATSPKPETSQSESENADSTGAHANKAEGSSTANAEDKKVEEKKEDSKLVTNEDDGLPWFDVGVISKNALTVSHYFNDRHTRLEEQLEDLVNLNGTKCVNDEGYTSEDKVPLLSGQTYRFRVAAVNGLGRGPFSESSSFKVSRFYYQNCT